MDLNEGYSMILGKEFLYKVSDKVQEIRSRGRYVWERRKNFPFESSF